MTDKNDSFAKQSGEVPLRLAVLAPNDPYGDLDIVCDGAMIGTVLRTTTGREGEAGVSFGGGKPAPLFPLGRDMQTSSKAVVLVLARLGEEGVRISTDDAALLLRWIYAGGLSRACLASLSRSMRLIDLECLILSDGQVGAYSMATQLHTGYARVWRSLQRLAERGLVTRERYPNLTKVGGMLLDYLVWRDSPRAPEFNL